MNKYIVLFLAALMVLGISWNNPAYGQGSSAAVMESAPVDVGSILAQLGSNYDCYFTIEDGFEDYTEWGLLPQKVQLLTTYPNLQSALDNLSQTVPHFAYKINKSNPRIIHIVDSRLLQFGDYALDNVIQDIHAEECLPTIVSIIGSQGIRIDGPNSISMQDMHFMDLTTRVRVKGKNLEVREALSNFIPLEGHSRILWMAETTLSPRAISHIKFFK